MSKEMISQSEPSPLSSVRPIAIPRRSALAVGAGAVAGVVLGPSLSMDLFGAATNPSSDSSSNKGKRRVVVWSEGTANVDPSSKAVYPKDVNFAIAEGLKPLEAEGWEVVMANINDPDQGVSDERLGATDVLIWWGHKRHGDVKDELVDKIVARVRDGKMGFIGTHSCHFAKPFKK